MQEEKTIPNVPHAKQIFIDDYFLITTSQFLNSDDLKSIKEWVAPALLFVTECRALDELALIEEQHALITNLKLSHYLIPSDPLQETARFESKERKMFLVNTAKLMNQEALKEYCRLFNAHLQTVFLNVKLDAADIYSLMGSVKDFGHEVSSFHLQGALNAISQEQDQVRQAKGRKEQVNAMQKLILARQELARYMQVHLEILKRIVEGILIVIDAYPNLQPILHQAKLLKRLLKPQVDLESMARPNASEELSTLLSLDRALGICSCIIQ